MTIGGAGILVYVGLDESSVTYDSRGWYLTAGAVFAAGLLVWLWFFLIWPLIVRANAWRVRTLAKAEADTPLRPDRPNRGRERAGMGLEILGGRWHSKHQELDVTETLRGAVVANRLDIAASNEFFTPGGDLEEGEPKNLDVRYAIGGREAAKTLPEGSRVVLP